MMVWCSDVSGMVACLVAAFKRRLASGDETRLDRILDRGYPTNDSSQLSHSHRAPDQLYRIAQDTEEGCLYIRNEAHV